MHAPIRTYFTTGVAIVGAGVIAVSPSIVAPDALRLPDMAAAQQTVAHETQLLSFGVLQPAAEAFMSAFGDVSSGLTGAGGTFLNGLADQITGGTNVADEGLIGGAHLLASGLVGGVDLATAGAATGAESFTQIIQGLTDATGELTMGADGSLPGPGHLVAALADVSGGFTGAGGTLLGGLSDQITGGTELVNHELNGGAALAASGIVGGTGLLTAGTTNGAHAAGQVVGGLADGVRQLTPGSAAAGDGGGESSDVSTSVPVAKVSDSGTQKSAAAASGDGKGARVGKGDGADSGSGGASARRSHGSPEKGGASGSGRGVRHAQK